MWVYLYPNNTETELKGAYIWIPNPDSISLNKSSIILTTVWQTEQITATVLPTISDHSVTWSSDDTTVATVDQTWLVTCVSPWICTITATTINNLTATCGITDTAVYFDFWDWTNSWWTAWGVQGTVTKYSNKVTFYNSGNFCQNKLSQYPIDWTANFLLEFNANIPNTSASYHRLWLQNVAVDWGITFETGWESNHRNKIFCRTDTNWSNWNGNWYAGESNPWTTDYFIKKEWNVLTMWWGWATKYTDNNYSFEAEYYLAETVYNDTMTINTAKLTYL